MSGDGSSGYQDDAAFIEAGIDLVYQRFEHPVYAQRGLTQFVPGLSVLDAIFNCGFAGAAQLLESARRTEPGHAS